MPSTRRRYVRRLDRGARRRSTGRSASTGSRVGETRVFGTRAVKPRFQSAVRVRGSACVRAFSRRRASCRRATRCRSLTADGRQWDGAVRTDLADDCDRARRPSDSSAVHRTGGMWNGPETRLVDECRANPMRISSAPWASFRNPVGSVRASLRRDSRCWASHPVSQALAVRRLPRRSVHRPFRWSAHSAFSLSSAVSSGGKLSACRMTLQTRRSRSLPSRNGWCSKTNGHSSARPYSLGCRHLPQRSEC